MNHRLNISCQTSALSELRNFLKNSLQQYSLSEIDRHQVTLAVEEVCANLIIHSHGCNPQDKINLEIKDAPEKIIFEISDQGEAFNILEYEAPDLKKVILINFFCLK